MQLTIHISYDLFCTRNLLRLQLTIRHTSVVLYMLYIHKGNELYCVLPRTLIQYLVQLAPLAWLY